MDVKQSDPAPGDLDASSAEPGLSRRALMTAGAFSAAAGAAAGVAAVARAQETPAAPAIATGAVAGQPFRAFVRQGTDRGVVDLKLRAMKPRQVLVRTKASCGCYTVTTSVLGDAAMRTPVIPNHSGMGVVEAVGAEVRRVRAGDRVLVSGTPWCGQCYQCLTGAPEWCSYLAGGAPNDPVAELADGTDVIQDAVIGGLSELMVAYEEYCVPVFTDLPDDQIAMLGDTGGVGLATADVYDPVQFGQTVVIFGAGPLGLAAVQGARAKGASQIIMVEPAAYRRERATAFGATTVLDPNEDTDGLVERIRDLTRGPTDRIDAGGRYGGPGFISTLGGDLVIEASGLDRFPPAVEPGPDPTGLLALRQAWDVTTPGGSLITLAVQNGDIAFPASAFCLSGKRIYGGQMAGMNVMRDTPRFIRVMETGQVDLGAIVTASYPIEGIVDGFQKVADRTELGVVFTFG